MQGRPSKAATVNPVKEKDYFLYFKEVLEHLQPKEDASADAKQLWEDFSKAVESLQKPKTKAESQQKEPEKPKSKLKR